MCKLSMSKKTWQMEIVERIGRKAAAWVNINSFSNALVPSLLSQLSSGKGIQRNDQYPKRRMATPGREGP